jgi:hypothetical protein
VVSGATYLSWLNQVELWFVKSDHGAIARAFSVADLSRNRVNHIRLYAKSARLFRWKYSYVRRRIVTK